MIQFLRNISIKTKLTLVIMLSSTIMLLLISTIVLIAEIYTARTVLQQELRILANTLSANSRQALVLGQYYEIDVLLKSLVHQDNIHAAYFFDSTGEPIAEYLQLHDSSFVFQALQSDFKEIRNHFWDESTTEHQFSSIHHFSLFSPIFFQGQQVGTLYLLSDLNRLYGHLSGVAFAVILAVLLMILVSWLLAGYLQKPVSEPLLQLAGQMKNVSVSNDYSLRAEKHNSDEVGILVDCFNRMLEQIELHQASLAGHQLYLEQTVIDRTAELRTAVTALDLARQQAESASEAKSHFLSQMTHELRTPLIGVLGMNELLTRTPLTEQQQLLVDTVQKSGEQLLHLISDVLDFSRIEAGKMLLENSPFELGQLFREIVALLSRQAQEKNLSVQLNIPANTVWNVNADESRIRQVLINLIGNAIKFTPAGAITVDLNCIRQDDHSGTFVFEVTDTGVGMTQEVQQQIFDGFYQAGETGAVSSGTGLGLAIVRQLVELMAGKLNLASTPGLGSRFRVTVDFLLTEKNSLQKGVSE